MNWLWIGTSVTAVTTATTRCVLAQIRAASRRRTLEAALKDATPVERVAILRALRGWTKLE